LRFGGIASVVADTDGYAGMSLGPYRLAIFLGVGLLAGDFELYDEIEGLARDRGGGRRSARLNRFEGVLGDQKLVQPFEPLAV
jgi:hypothetical protein